MEYKNQTENRAFQEMLQAAVKRLQNRSGEEQQGKRSPQGIPLGGCGHKHQDDIPAL